MRHVVGRNIWPSPTTHTLLVRVAAIVLAFLLTSCGSSSDTQVPTAPVLGNDATLSSLSISGANLDPAFSASVTDYAASVPNSTDNVNVSATASDGGASTTVNGGIDTNVQLEVGDNTISILVTAEDGTTSRSYTIVVTRAASDNANLSSLELTNIAFDPDFIFSQSAYTALVTFDTVSTQVIATPEHANAAVSVNGFPVASGEASAPIDLQVGTNTITINVTAEDGITRRSYSVVITRHSASAFTQTAYIKASNPDEYDVFGSVVELAADGATLAVGTIREDSGASGVNGDDTDNSAEAAGAVYVFARDSGGAWAQQGYVKASNTEHWEYFGSSAALSSDGSTLVVGARLEDSAATGIYGDESDNSAPGSGAVYVFTRDSNEFWVQQAYIKASNAEEGDEFGAAVALSADGATLAVGAQLESSDATGVNGDRSESAQWSGAVYVFSRDNQAVWSQQAYVKASNTGMQDFFGGAVALSADGATLAVGASGEDSAARGVNGDEMDNSAPGAGAVYLFARGISGAWVQQAYIKASNAGVNDGFGSAVELSADGTRLAIGASGEDSAARGVNGDEMDNSAPGAGAVYLFARGISGAWVQQAYIKASNSESWDGFGRSVALSTDGTLIAVGGDFYGFDISEKTTGGQTRLNSTGQRMGNLEDSGAVYTFTRDSTGAWNQESYVKASNTEPNDQFGDPVALSADGTMLVVGATGEDGAAALINGDQTDNSAENSGAAYIFELADTP